MEPNKYPLDGIEAIIFDLGGVVLNLDYQATIDAFKKLGKQNFDELYTQANQDKIFDQYETGQISSPQFRDYFRKFLSESISDDQIDAAWNKLLLNLPKERIELLYELKEKYPIFLFSNTNDIHLKCFRQIIKHSFGDEDLLEKVFNKTYYSHLLGMRKPNIEAFQYILDEQSLTAERTLFIDDSIQHIEGARKLGIQTIHLTDREITDLF